MVAAAGREVFNDVLIKKKLNSSLGGRLKCSQDEQDEPIPGRGNSLCKNLKNMKKPGMFRRYQYFGMAECRGYESKAGSLVRTI